MKKFLWKLALQTLIPVLCGLVAVNAYLVARNLKGIEKATRQGQDAQQRQADIAALGFDLQGMETSQRGYLLTGDSAYLSPYEQAEARLTSDVAGLRARLAPRDGARVAKFESAAQAKKEEMKETIRLRGQGYRHRAFLIEGSNSGKGFMEEARAALDALSAAQARDAARHERERNDAVANAARQSASASAALLGIALITWLAFQRYRARLELACELHEQQLRSANRQLERFAGTVFGELRNSIEEAQDHAAAVLDGYGDFLPRQAHERLERIAAGTRNMLGTLQGLSADAGAGPAAEEAPLDAAEPLSA